MSSSHEPIYQLEPSNLLEPLDLAERPAESICRLAHPDYGTSKPAATPAMPRQRVAPPIGRGRPRLKSALLLAGALGCVAAGAALPRLATLVWGDVDAAQMGLARTLAGVTRLSERAADVAVKPDAPKAAASATASKEAAAANASDQPPATANASKQSSTAANTPAEPPAPPNASRPSAAPSPKEAKAAPCNQHAAADNNCLEGAVAVAAAPASQPVTINPPPSAPAVPQAAAPPAAPSPAATAQPAESPSAGERASVQKEERSQPSRQSRRVAKRDTSRTPAPRRDWAAADTAPAERYTERWEDRGADRTSGWRRDWGADDRAAGQGFWDWQDRDRWQGRDANRDSNRSRGDRYDDYARGEGRRAVERNWRSDDRPIARSSREEVPVMPAPQFRFGW